MSAMATYQTMQEYILKLEATVDALTKLADVQDCVIRQQARQITGLFDQLTQAAESVEYLEQFQSNPAVLRNRRAIWGGEARGE